MRILLKKQSRQDENLFLASEYLKQCVKILSNLKTDPAFELEPIIEFVKQKNVCVQFTNIINLFPRRKYLTMCVMKMCVENMHEVTVMRVICVNSSGQKYFINFYPNTHDKLFVQKIA
jgi:hypothetical protein